MGFSQMVTGLFSVFCRMHRIHNMDIPFKLFKESLGYDEMNSGPLQFNDL